MSRFFLTRLLHDTWLIFFDQLRSMLSKNHFRREIPKHYLGYILPGKIPIILLQGYGNKWEFISKLGDHLSRQGHPIHVVPGLKNNLFDIPTSAHIVRDHIERENINNAIIVAHSKGGLIGKYVLAYLNEDNRVRGMVSIGTPYSGTAITQFLRWKKNTQEFDLDSKIVADLQNHNEVNHKIISIYPKHDDLVWHKKGSYLEGALDNIKLNERGHRRPLFSKTGHSKVSKAVERLART